jgi:hypothetical protein
VQILAVLSFKNRHDSMNSGFEIPILFPIVGNHLVMHGGSNNED